MLCGAVLLCAAEDLDQNDETPGREYFMSVELMVQLSFGLL